jgi:hypothetical protein
MTLFHISAIPLFVGVFDLVKHIFRPNHMDCLPVVSTGCATQAQKYRSSLVEPELVGFQASLALISNQALW